MPFSILVHGGAGPLTDTEGEALATAGCLAAARRGAAVLARGGAALDAVEAAVQVLEDDPAFNAGLGAALNVDGEVELDASIMDGATLAAGAVAAVRTFRNPVGLARLVMERSGHVLLVGEGATLFARQQGVPEVPNASLVTPRARARWEARRAASHGTVGAVARDAGGHVAAATSTGGTTNKLRGRVGDSPLIGCGTYADDALGAASATGLGEAIIRVTLTRHALDLLHHGLSPRAAAEQGVAALKRVGGEGGVILVSPQGALAAAFNTERMAHAWVDSAGSEGAAFSATKTL